MPKSELMNFVEYKVLGFCSLVQQIQQLDDHKNK